MVARMRGEATWIESPQRVGAQAIMGRFRTVATAVAEAEAGAQSFRERHAQAAAKFWTRTQTLPGTSPQTSLRLKLNKRSASSIQKIASKMYTVDTKPLEVIHELALAPWDERVDDGRNRPSGADEAWRIGGHHHCNVQLKKEA